MMGQSAWYVIVDEETFDLQPVEVEEEEGERFSSPYLLANVKLASRREAEMLIRGIHGWVEVRLLTGRHPWKMGQPAHREDVAALLQEKAGCGQADAVELTDEIFTLFRSRDAEVLALMGEER